MVDELAEVGVGRRDRRVVVTPRLVGILHRPGESLQVHHGLLRLGQQVGGIGLQGREQEIEVLQIHRGGRREREAEFGHARGQALPRLPHHVYGGDLSVG